jgi:predicted DNA-binding transcriptional regulator AlpA
MTSFEIYEVEISKGQLREQEFLAPDMLTVNGVASTLGMSVRTLRRMIKEGTFPNSHIHRGQTAYWQRQFVRTWQRERLRSAPNQKRSGRYSDLDVIDRDEEKQFGRKPIDAQAMVRTMETMKSLLESDPSEFVRQHPHLKKWVRERGML